MTTTLAPITSHEVQDFMATWSLQVGAADLRRCAHCDGVDLAAEFTTPFDALTEEEGEPRCSFC